MDKVPAYEAGDSGFDTQYDLSFCRFAHEIIKQHQVEACVPFGILSLYYVKRIVSAPLLQDELVHGNVQQRQPRADHLNPDGCIPVRCAC